MKNWIAAMPAIALFALPAVAQLPLDSTQLIDGDFGVPLVQGGSTTIDFDGLPAGTVVTNQFPEASFSSESGQVNQTVPCPACNTSPPNILCSADAGGGANCAMETHVDFTDPSDTLTFLGAGVDSTGVVAQVRVFTTTAPAGPAPIVDIIGQGTPTVPVLVDLTSFPGVTRIEIINLIADPGGIGWDDFNFTPVPIPVELIDFHLD